MAILKAKCCETLHPAGFRRVFYRFFQNESGACNSANLLLYKFCGECTFCGNEVEKIHTRSKVIYRQCQLLFSSGSIFIMTGLNNHTFHIINMVIQKPTLF